MKQKLIWLLFICTIILMDCVSAQSRDYYQFKIYSIENEQQEHRVDQYLKEAYLPALHRAGIPSVGVFKPIEEDEMYGKLIFVCIPVRSLGQFEKLPTLLNDDKQYQQDGQDYINATYDNAPFSRIESILLKAFKNMPEFSIPEHSTAPSGRIYELRSYEGATEEIYERKVEMFNEGGECKIFIDLGFQPLFFGEVISGPSMPNLMYLTTFESRKSQEEHWNAFIDNPDWAVLKEVEKYQHTVSHIDKYLLYPTDYSDF